MIKFTAGFTAGFLTYYVIDKNQNRIADILRKWIAQLELKNDILKHDNPDLKG